MTTRLEKQKKGFFRDNKNKNMEYDPAESEYTVQTPVYHERSRLPVFLLIMSGMAAGAVAFWLLAVPAIKQGIYQEANQQIVQYSESLATQGAELTKAADAMISGFAGISHILIGIAVLVLFRSLKKCFE